MSTLYPQYHVLASVNGYQTVLKSRGVLDEDLRQLESLGFGQTDQESYLSSLDSRPAAIGRPLPSGRYAITRCLRGGFDTAGRVTLKFVSIVFSQKDWLQIVSRDILGVLQNLDVWNTVLAGPDHFAVRLSPRPISNESKALALALLDEMIKASDDAVLVLPDSQSCSDAVMLLPSLLPLKERALIKWGVRVLSTGTSVRVCTLPTIGDCGGRRKTIRFQDGGVLSTSYAMALQYSWLDPLSPPYRFIDQTGSICHHIGCDEVEDGQGSAPENSDTRSLNFSRHLLIGVVCIGLIIFVSIYTMGSSDPIVLQEEKPLGDIANEESPSVIIDSELGVRHARLVSNETEAIRLVEQFGSSNKWTEKEIGEWLDEAMSLSDVERIAGYRESVLVASDLLDWLRESSSQIALITRKWSLVGSIDDTGDAVELQADLAVLQGLREDQRQVGFLGIEIPMFKELMYSLNTRIQKLDKNRREEALQIEIEEQEQVREEQRLSNPVKVPDDDEEAVLDPLDRFMAVLDEVRQFRRLSKKNPESYERSPSVDTLVEWWAMLDFKAFEPPREFISDRKNAREPALLAMVWRFMALKEESLISEDERDREVIREKIITLDRVHSAIDPPEYQSEELNEAMAEFLDSLEDADGG